MSALRLASRLVDEAAVAGSRHVPLLLRVALWLTAPAAALAALTLAFDPTRFISFGVDVTTLTADDAETIAAVATRAVALYAPLWLGVTLCSLALEGVISLAGWQLLHGRSASPRALLLGLYARRWAVLGLAFTKTLVIGAAQLALVLVVGVGVGLASVSIPGFTARLMEAAAAPLVMVEEAGPVGALRRSFQLVRRRWGASAWAWLLAVALSGVVVLNLEGLARFSGLMEEEGGGLLAAVTAPRAYVASLVIALAGVPVRGMVLVALYRHLRVATEGWYLGASPLMRGGRP